MSGLHRLLEAMEASEARDASQAISTRSPSASNSPTVLPSAVSALPVSQALAGETVQPLCAPSTSAMTVTPSVTATHSSAHQRPGGVTAARTGDVASGCGVRAAPVTGVVEQAGNGGGSASGARSQRARDTSPLSSWAVPCDSSPSSLSVITSPEAGGARQHVPDSPPSAGGFACPSCGRMFSKRYNQQAHMRIHTNQRPFACSICSKSFMWKSSLKSHAKMHAKHAPPASVISKSSSASRSQQTALSRKRVSIGKDVSSMADPISQSKMPAVSLS